MNVQARPTRQVHYGAKDPAPSLDVLLSLNGLPVATAELKNPFTGQTCVDAEAQYRGRDSREPVDLGGPAVHQDRLARANVTRQVAGQCILLLIADRVRIMPQGDGRIEVHVRILEGLQGARQGARSDHQGEDDGAVFGGGARSSGGRRSHPMGSPQR